MAQRNSGHKRKKLDLYETPAWVVAEGLALHFPVRGLKVCEPCCGRNAMVAVLDALGAIVTPSDIKDYPRRRPHHPMAPGFRQLDFLESPLNEFDGFDAYTINPPYGDNGLLAEAFIRRGLQLLHRGRRAAWMAVLLRSDFDAAARRAALFEDNRNFRATITLRRRIEWFEREPGDSGPSENHAWFVWHTIERQVWETPWKLYAPKPTLSAVMLLDPRGQVVARQMRFLEDLEHACSFRPRVGRP